MIIGISATGKTLESMMDQRFGRAPYFILIDINTMDYEVIDNGANAPTGGAGITSAQMIADKGVGAIITGNIGPNAMNVLRAAQIDIFRGYSVTVKDNFDKYKKGLLEQLDTNVSYHFGMGSKVGGK